jgi:MarR family transcriptional regulator, organic hydroperoxide resistance regulator
MVLKDFLPYLLNRAGVRIGLSFSRDVAAYKVTLPIWRVLAALWESGDQRLIELSALTSIDFSTLSRILVNMERRRLIARRRSGSDARALSVSLTAQGRDLTKKIIPIALYYEKVAISGLSRAEVKNLKHLLDKLYINIESFDRPYDESKINGGFSSRRAHIPAPENQHLSWRKDKSARRRQITL